MCRNFVVWLLRNWSRYRVEKLLMRWFVLRKLRSWWSSELKIDFCICFWLIFLVIVLFVLRLFGLIFELLRRSMLRIFFGKFIYWLLRFIERCLVGWMVMIMLYFDVELSGYMLFIWRLCSFFIRVGCRECVFGIILRIFNV